MVTKTSPLVGSEALVPLLLPPREPGSWTVSRLYPAGVNSPSLRAAAIFSFHVARSSGVRKNGLISSAVIFCRAKGGGAVGKGCVGQACSPGTSLCGTGRSSMGQSGSPVTRSKTYRKPVLPACATASTIFPLWRTVISCGAEQGSESQRSW